MERILSKNVENYFTSKSMAKILLPNHQYSRNLISN
jgi:hypothetical protein